jgi:DNA-binding Xre family transcriptional regulator
MINEGKEVNKTELSNKYGIRIQTLLHLLNGKTFKNPPKQ